LANNLGHKYHVMKGDTSTSGKAHKRFSDRHEF
jgi:hypothetical protein